MSELLIELFLINVRYYSMTASLNEAILENIFHAHAKNNNIKIRNNFHFNNNVSKKC